jgi:hypothetical protein
MVAGSRRHRDRNADGGLHTADSAVHVDGKPVLVATEEAMSDRDFMRHMNKRHGDSLHGIFRTRLTCDLTTVDYLRPFHAALHRWRIYRDHEHG